MSLLVKKQGLILFIIFDMGSVQYKCLFWPTDPDFLLCNVISGLGKILRKRLGGDKKVLFSSAVKCRGGEKAEMEKLLHDTDLGAEKLQHQTLV